MLDRRFTARDLSAACVDRLRTSRAIGHGLQFVDQKFFLSSFLTIHPAGLGKEVVDYYAGVVKRQTCTASLTTTTVLGC